MRARRLASGFGCSIGVLIVAGFMGTGIHAQDARASHHGSSDQKKVGALIKTVREATERFKDPASVEAEDYFPTFGCVSGSSLPTSGTRRIRRRRRS